MFYFFPERYSQKTSKAGYFSYLTQILNKGSVSWLDHIVSSSDFHNCIKTVSIDHDLSDADHIPVRMDISLDDIPGSSSSDEGSYMRLCWDKLNADGRAKYRDISHKLLSQLMLVIVPDAVYCTDVNCTDPVRVSTINWYDGATAQKSLKRKCIFSTK